MTMKNTGRRTPRAPRAMIEALEGAPDGYPDIKIAHPPRSAAGRPITTRRTVQRATAPGSALPPPQTEQTEVPCGIGFPHLGQVRSGGAIMSFLKSETCQGQGGNAEDHGLQCRDLHRVEAKEYRLTVAEELQSEPGQPPKAEVDEEE